MNTVDFLATVPGFDALAGEDLERAVSSARELEFSPGDYLMRRGDAGTVMHVVKSGEVKVPIFDGAGRLRMEARLGEGEIVGEMALLTGERRRADVIAAEPTVTVAFAREVITPLLGEHPPLARFLTEILGKRLEQAGGIEQVGKYRLLGKIGEGATAKVYEALHPGLNRTVALKMLGHQLVYDRVFRERFLDEARTIAGLGHPNIVQVFDTEQAYATWFVVMERLEGSDLHERLKDKPPLDPEEASGILLQVAEALSYAHSQGVVHRDVKPANIAVDDDGTVKLMDFGIARRIKGQAGTTKVVEGTPRYIAPEAAVGKSVDGRADIYALGVVAFEMLTGRPLFGGRTIKELVEAHAFNPPPDIARVRPGLPAPLVRFVRESLKKKPEDRIGDWTELRGLLGGSDSVEGAMARLEERIVRVRYRPESRGRVDRAVAALRKTMAGLPDSNVAEAVLSATIEPSPDETGKQTTGWFSRLTGGAKSTPDSTSTRAMPAAEKKD